MSKQEEMRSANNPIIWLVGGDWVCPKCHTNNSGGLSECRKCGFNRKSIK